MVCDTCEYENRQNLGETMDEKYYRERLKVIDDKIEHLIDDIIDDGPYKSPRAEERLTALCKAREYYQGLLDIISPKHKNCLCSLGILDEDTNKEEVNNEG